MGFGGSPFKGYWWGMFSILGLCQQRPFRSVWWSVHLALLPEVVSCPVNLSWVHLFPAVSIDLAGDVCCWEDPVRQALGLKMGRRWAQGGRAPKTQRSQVKPFSYSLWAPSLPLPASLSFAFLVWGLLFLIECLQHYRITICFPRLLCYFRSWILSCVDS